MTRPLELYGYWRSSSSWRVRIALTWKGVAWESRPVHLRRGDQLGSEHEARNPMRQVPWLEIAPGRGLGQSMAILEWLEEAHPAPPLLPRDPWLRAKARQLAETVNSGIQPLQNLAVLRKVKHELDADPDAWARDWIAPGLAALERETSATAGTFCVGDEPSFADVFLVPQLFNARRYGVDVSEAAFPTLLRIEGACEELPAFAASHPDRQPDKE
jgi:maleylpyruvate isomerase